MMLRRRKSCLTSLRYLRKYFTSLRIMNAFLFHGIDLYTDLDPSAFVIVVLV